MLLDHIETPKPLCGVVIFARPLLRNRGISKDHGSPEVGQLSNADARDFMSNRSS